MTTIIREREAGGSTSIHLLFVGKSRVVELEGGGFVEAIPDGKGGHRLTPAQRKLVHPDHAIHVSPSEPGPVRLSASGMVRARCVP